MEYKEAIDRLKDHVATHCIGEYPHIHIYEAMKMAITSMEKQIPEQVMYFDGVAEGLECPSCKAWYRDGDRHCPRCGQRVFAAN